MKTFQLKLFPALVSLTIIFFSSGRLYSQAPQSGSDVIRLMHKRYFHAPCKSYTFSQKNAHYRNDSVIRRSEWHEAVEFPDKFRINFGDQQEGNFVIFKRDTAFNYKKGGLVKTRPDSSSILLFIGGMYYRELNDVLLRMKHERYDLSQFSIQKWKDEDVYVIGAKEGDKMSNQLWVDKKTLKVLRILEKLNATDQMDMRFEAHQKMCGGFSETKVSFRRNGKLEQVEEYYNIKEGGSFPDK